MSRDAWLEALIGRHTADFTRPEFLKAVRALSSRYVEDRARLASRSPLDSAGKRAAFAGFYAPLHYLTAGAVLRALAPFAPVSRVIDLGCGTGVAALAWAETQVTPVSITGIDQSAWALDEMRWNCQARGLVCRTHRLSLVDALERELAGPRRASLTTTGIVCAWSLNELTPGEQDRVRTALLEAHRRGASVLVIEPVASSVVPWWDSWRAPIVAAGGRADEWRFAPDLPNVLAELDEAAGFRREALTARSFWFSHS
jgi:SAM-dependent methyltransferase